MSSLPETGPAESLVGSVLADRYRLDELLGEGGMGKVYAAEHVLMRKRVAVKVLHRELCDDKDVVARFEREAMTTANIEHPNIAAATDCGKLPDGSLFLVLELVQGKSLRDEIAAGPMPLARALHVAQQIASALGAAHALGIVHRDLKPENVMLVAQGEDPDFVKMLDFGLAKLTEGAAGGAVPLVRAPAPLTKVGVVYGTPEYMPPEQALGLGVDHRADLYALGVITYELLSGVRPFSAQSDTGLLGQQLSRPVPAFAERAPGIPIPERVEQVVQRLLAKELSARFQTAQEVERAFEELLRPAAVAEPDGAPTAILGTAAELYGPVAAPAVPPPEPAQGPGGTLLLDEGRTREVAERVAEARASDAARRAPLAPARASVWRRAASSASQEVAGVCDFIDESRARLPEAIRNPLRSVPARALLAVAALLVAIPIGLVWLVAAWSGRPAARAVAQSAALPAEATPGPDPVLAELASAKQEGHSALEKLAERHPKHARVSFELALSHAARSEHSAAVACLGRALAADAKLGAEPASSVLLGAAARQRDSASAALGLLEGPMGAAGAAVIYDLSVDQKVLASTRTRAQKWVVQSPAFLKVAPPNIEVAAKLRYAKSCADRHKLLPRAGEVGDRRALTYLKIMNARSGCGRRSRDDCFPCLRKDTALEQAILAIERRLGDKP